MKTILKHLLFFMLIFNICFAQSIVINSSDWQNVHSIGTEAISYTTELGKTHEVFIGESSSEPQYWDFSQIPFPESATGVYIEPNAAPLYGTYPETNLVFKTTSLLGDQSFVAYNYNKIESNQLIGFAVGSDQDFADLAYDPYIKIISFPLAYGTEWETTYESEFAGIFTTQDTSMFEVDAYGTIKLPHGEFPAVRIKIHGIAWIDGIPNYSESIHFYTKTLESVSLVFPMGQNLSNTTAQAAVTYSRGVGATAIVEHGNLTNNYTLHQNYPNPFNPETVIKYQLAAQCVVKLKIYDLLGREMALLLNKEKPAGEHSIKFNADYLPSGIYIYKIQTDNGFVESKKMALIK